MRDAAAGALAGGGFGGLLAGGIAYEGSRGLPPAVRRAIAIPAAVAGAVIGAAGGSMIAGGSKWWLGKEAALDPAGLMARSAKRMQWGGRLQAHGTSLLAGGQIGKSTKAIKASLDASRRGIGDFMTGSLRKSAARIPGLSNMGMTVSRPGAVGRKLQLGAAALRKVPGLGKKVAEENMTDKRAGDTDNASDEENELCPTCRQPRRMKRASDADNASDEENELAQARQRKRMQARRAKTASEIGNVEARAASMTPMTETGQLEEGSAAAALERLIAMPGMSAGSVKIGSLALAVQQGRARRGGG